MSINLINAKIGGGTPAQAWSSAVAAAVMTNSMIAMLPYAIFAWNRGNWAGPHGVMLATTPCNIQFSVSCATI
jgi:hypothetical protein